MDNEKSTFVDAQEWLTTDEVAELLGISPETVRSHIHCGNIRAVDVSPSGSVRRKPIYRIPRPSLTDFLAGRLNLPPIPPDQRKRRVHKVRQGDIVEFF